MVILPFNAILEESKLVQLFGISALFLESVGKKSELCVADENIR